MSADNCLQFFRLVNSSSEVFLQFRAATNLGELVRLAATSDLEFSRKDLEQISATINTSEFPRLHKMSSKSEIQEIHFSRSKFQHFEIDLNRLPGFNQVEETFQHLKVKPTTVDLVKFNADFSENDLLFTEMKPSDPGFRERYQRSLLPRPGLCDLDPSESAQKQFHLVNLDEHTEWAGYDHYFRSKTLILGWLSELLGDSTRFSGSLWYPPHSYRLWHTNANQPGWRMYLIDFENPSAVEQDSYFRYANPYTGEVVTLYERPKIARFFRIEQQSDKLFWHCIVNRSPTSRWSFGFSVPDNWTERLGFPIDAL